MRNFLLGVIATFIFLPALGYGLYYGVTRGFFGSGTGDAGQITALARPSSAESSARAAQEAARTGLGAGSKQVLFGDFHVHTTFSTDAFLISLPILQGEGAHPPADACDFARYCAALDFWALTDHAEGLTSQQWQESRQLIRECDAAAGSAQDQDLVSFLGWEWTQVGTNAENHYGHKNVIMREITNSQTPERPIASIPPEGGGGLVSLGVPHANLAVLAALAPNGRRQDYLNFARFLNERAANVPCPEGVHVRAMPEGCSDGTKTPAELFTKLRQWNYPAAVIPHGTTWGFYTPPGAVFDKHLTDGNHDPELQYLLEIASGHGNSEEYRPWRAVRYDADGQVYCPPPSADYLPSCWQAGVIIEQRCLAEGSDKLVCAARAEETRQAHAEGGGQGFLIVTGARPEDWLDAGQCRDCFQPSFNYRPGNSGQYALAITNFANDGNPRNLRFGFMASSDNHFARPGTGYKEYGRHGMTEAVGSFAPGTAFDPHMRYGPIMSRPAPLAERLENLQIFERLETERNASFFVTGGLIAVHSEARNRGAIWQAMEKKETYGTSGDRILLWFDLDNAPQGRLAMGSETMMAAAPRFTVRAAGAFKQKPGCPDYARQALGEEKLQALCLGECYNPSNERKKISHIEVVRIRPQTSPEEDPADLIEDPWRRLPCDDEGQGCTASFTDGEFAASGRSAIYYVRAIQEASLAVNGNNLRCTYDENGVCVKVLPCYGDYRTEADDNCLAPAAERAWSSPIYIDHSGVSAQAARQ